MYAKINHRTSSKNERNYSAKNKRSNRKRQKWDVRDNVLIELLLSQHSPKSIINKIYRLIEQKSSNYVSFEKARTTKLKIESIELREDICQN